MAKDNNQDNFYKCENCGSNLVFSASIQNLFCESCRVPVAIEKNTNVSKRPYTVDDSNNNKAVEWKNTNSVFECKNCGAKVIMDKNTHSTTCPYCSAPYDTMLENVSILKPDAIIPFQFDKEKAQEFYKKGIRAKKFVPNAIRNAPPMDTFKAIYIPIFSFDALSSNTYEGVLGEIEERTDFNNRVSTYTRKWRISGTKNMMHKDIAVESSSQMTQIDFEKIQPYNNSCMFAFDQAYILGSAVEYYNNDLAQCEELSRQIMREETKSVILSKYNYDTVESFNMQSTFSDINYNYQLLPTYRVDYQYKNKKYTTFMNGQTGKVGGGVPRSPAKITGFILFILSIVALILMLCNVMN